ncbi:MAG: AtpZ/AtpI family protein [Geodermatophilaceae bacterium]|uniref:AtpZ/AtpI family protein n=1 Tax=Sporichthya sp. TaxID=65475 RepID=UPI0017E6070F|nr:AtpZ/AtpI family protein [Sporichthya sp.]MBA2415855.1 AtpZ/AtpI family protein [Geodermatophilaceae bacterium]MBA3743109.1 AtpZ/AtpI family protein [Sporichthya sp.]
MASDFEPSDQRSIRETALALAGIGMLNAVAAVGGCALGWLVDSQLDTTPVFILLGLVLGLACGVLVTWRDVSNYLRASE